MSEENNITNGNLISKFDKKKLLPYLSISVIATLLDYSSFLFFLSIMSVHYLIANSFSIIIGISTKFSLNKLITFKERNALPWYTQFIKFLSVSGSGFLLSNVILYLQVDLFSISEEISKIIAIGIVFVFTFVLHNIYSFNK